MLVFDIEMVSFERGVPPGYLFVWLQDSPEDLFDALDVNKNKEVPQEEVRYADCAVFHMADNGLPKVVFFSPISREQIE